MRGARWRGSGRGRALPTPNVAVASAGPDTGGVRRRAELRRRRAASRRLSRNLRRMALHKAAAAVLSAWACWVGVQRWREKRCRQMLSQRSARRVCLAFDSWCGAAAYAAAKKRVHHQWMARRLHGSLFSVFSAWARTNQLAQRQREHRQKVLSRLLHAGLCQALQSWCAYTARTNQLSVTASRTGAGGDSGAGTLWTR